MDCHWALHWDCCWVPSLGLWLVLHWDWSLD